MGEIWTVVKDEHGINVLHLRGFPVTELRPAKMLLTGVVLDEHKQDRLTQVFVDLLNATIGDE